MIRKLTQSTRLSFLRDAARTASTPARWTSSVTQSTCKHGHHVFVKPPDGREPEPALQQGSGFYKYIVAGEQCRRRAEQLSPHLLGGLVIGVITVEHRIQSGRIDKDRGRQG